MERLPADFAVCEVYDGKTFICCKKQILLHIVLIGIIVVGMIISWRLILAVFGHCM